MEGTQFSSIALDQIVPQLNNLGVKSLMKLQELVALKLKEAQDRERSEALNRIHEIAKSINMTPQEIIYGTSTPSRRAARYRDPNNSKLTWSGIGREPFWFKEAKEKGYTADQMRVKH